ncbi:hypothetical protein [Candidatus Palauibacter sp.]
MEGEAQEPRVLHQPPADLPAVLDDDGLHLVEQQFGLRQIGRGRSP